MYRDDRPVPLSKSCQLVGGRNGEPQNFSPDWHLGTSGCRTKKNEKALHRIPVTVKPTSGKIDQAKRGIAQNRTYSKKEMRALAITVLRNRGDAITDKAISEILKGKGL